MYTQSAGCGRHTGLAAPVLCPPVVSRRSAKRSVTAQRVSASADESAQSQASLQSRALGLGLGLALSLGITAAPATAADAVQGLQKAASGTTLGQTLQNAVTGNPLQGLQNSAGSASQKLTSSTPALPARDGPSIGTSLKDAFTKSPPQQASKGKASTPDIRGRFSTSAGLIGGAVLLLASSVLAGVKKGAPKAAAKGAKSAAKGAKSQARKVSGSQPFQGAKNALSKARSGGTQPAAKGAKKAQSSFGTQLNRVKSAAPSPGKFGNKAASAAKQAEQKAPKGGIGVAGLAAAGLVAGGVLFTVIAKPNTPFGNGSANPAAPVAEKVQGATDQKSGGVAVPPQEAQGSTFDLSLGTSPGPNSEPLNLRPSVADVDAPKPGGIPVFPPKGTSQEEVGSSAAPQEEGAAQESSVKPKGNPQGDLSAVDFGASVQEVNSDAGGLNPFKESKSGATTDQTLEPQGPAAEAQRSADQASQSKSDEDRIDRST